MSTDYFNPPNSVWPNGLKRDEEGYVNFYPIGTNKVDISTITWPKGTKVKSPFVYQGDTLVGFIDTKALDIDNNDTTIDINYTHFDADLDSIMENTLTINAPVNATVNVKYGAVDKVLTEKIEKLIGKGNCEVKFDKNNNKAIIAVALQTTETQLADVESLLNRVLPSNLVTEMRWLDELPINYTKLEYLESTGTQYISTDLFADLQTGGKITEAQTTQGTGVPLGGTKYQTGTSGIRWYVPHIEYLGLLQWGWVENCTSPSSVKLFEKQTSSLNWLNDKKAKGPDFEVSLAINDIIKDVPIDLFAYPAVEHNNIALWDNCRIYHAAISQDLEVIRNFIPCLNDTGTPGMYDTVTKVFKSNMGTGDFLYPTDVAPAISAGLDETFYAKLTEHGVRRLYHVPKGCTMSKDEYAAANGFKELVEPPMPLEGYWMPVWRETETQLICDWVETESPTE